MGIIIGCVIFLIFVGIFALIVEGIVAPIWGEEFAESFSELAFFPAFFFFVVVVMALAYMSGGIGGPPSLTHERTREDEMEKNGLYHPERVKAEIHFYKQAISEHKATLGAIYLTPSERFECSSGSLYEWSSSNNVQAYRSIKGSIDTLEGALKRWQAARIYTPERRECSRHLHEISGRSLKTAPVYTYRLP